MSQTWKRVGDAAFHEVTTAVLFLFLYSSWDRPYFLSSAVYLCTIAECKSKESDINTTILIKIRCQFLRFK